MAKKVPLPRWCRIVRDGDAAYAAASEAPLATDACAVWRILKPRMASEEVEVFVVLLLNGKNRILDIQEVSRGTATAALVHPREVFRLAVAHGAASIIMAHNHPSNDPTPSAEDHAITERLKQCGELLGIKILDHIVCAATKYHSFAEAKGW